MSPTQIVLIVILAGCFVWGCWMWLNDKEGYGGSWTLAGGAAMFLTSIVMYNGCG